MRWVHEFSSTLPVLDAGCGSGRNAIALARRGFQVVCADRDERRLAEITRSTPSLLRKSLMPICVSLSNDSWPFIKDGFGMIIAIHFLNPDLLPAFRSSLCVGGSLFIETIGGQGNNYLELPMAGTLHKMLSPHFDFLLYRERPVGPMRCGKAAVQLLARKI